MKASRSQYLNVRGLRYHVRLWGESSAPKLFMVHGWMDTAASFQFVVDHLQQEWQVIAPDWRGFGLSENTPADTYWFADYLADLDALLQHFAPGEAVNLLGHSMGGNVVSLYAGIRPERIKKLINLEGFGLPATRAEDAPKRMRRWLDELREEAVMKTYADLGEVAARLQKTNPRLPADRAAFLAEHWARQGEDGRWAILGDPVHKRNGPLLYQLDQVLACWGHIKAPVLWVEGAETEFLRWFGEGEGARAEIERRMRHIAQVEWAAVANAGHMLHHDQPQEVARLIERFLMA